MEIIHKVCINSKCHTKTCHELARIGIRMENAGDGKIISLSCFDIRESDILWPKVKEIIDSLGIIPITETIFSEEEVQSSEWVVIRPDFICGYPMPDLDFGYKDVSFDPKKECPVCGAGLEQTGPIHLKEEPKLGKNDFMGINWTLNLFTRPEVIELMQNEGIGGFEVMPVINHFNMKKLTTVQQLKFTREHSRGVIGDNLESEQPECGHVKYLALSQGMYKFTRKSLDGMSGFIKTSEWFGSGHLALNLILASSDFVNLYCKNRWNGLRLEPVELVV